MALLLGHVTFRCGGGSITVSLSYSHCTSIPIGWPTLGAVVFIFGFYIAEWAILALICNAVRGRVCYAQQRLYEHYWKKYFAEKMMSATMPYELNCEMLHAEGCVEEKTLSYTPPIFPLVYTSLYPWPKGLVIPYRTLQQLFYTQGSFFCFLRHNF